MREFEIQKVSLTVKWIYDRIIPSLPGAGTEAFGVLCRKLAPFGLSASHIIFDAPSTKLGDVTFTIILLDGRLGIRFFVTYFEIIVDELYEDDEENVRDIADIVFEALKKIDTDVDKGKANFRLMYHLRLKPEENMKMLAEYLKANDSRLKPEMAIFQIEDQENSPLQIARLAVAQSALYENAIFIDLNLEYRRDTDIYDFSDKVKTDVFSIFKLMNLQESAENV